MLRIFGVFYLTFLFLFPSFVSAALSPEERAKLEAQLADLERQIDENKKQLSSKQTERQSLERDVAVLDGQIKDAQLAIKQRDLTITKLNDGIADKESAIAILDAKVEKGQESIAQMIRRTREIDETTLVELALGNNISDLFTEIDEYQAVQNALDQAFQTMSILRDDLSGRKEALLSQQTEEEEMRQLQLLQRRSLEQNEREKEELIKVTKGQEKVYQSTIEAAQRTAGEIRARLFDLRDSGAIPFGTAYEYAKAASAKTGVRPALILAVLRQETNLGENVGQCLLTNSPKKGDGKGKNTGRAISGVMKPERDVDPFMQITAELGIDPASQVVSCPQSVGYGGAMGPAQFIPSTWMLYKDRLAATTGQNPPSPWNARTAIFATALLMQDNGATGDRASERRAALKYFAGGNWSKPAFAFYGDGVMGYADQYQKDIDVLEN
jgi:peptidoglycan hydrolase CwlO-like protein